MNNINLKGDFFSKMFGTFSSEEKEDAFRKIIKIPFFKAIRIYYEENACEAK